MIHDSHGRPKNNTILKSCKRETNNTNTDKYSLYERIQKSTIQSIKNMYKLQPMRYKSVLICDNNGDNNGDNNCDNNGIDNCYFKLLFIFMGSYILYYYKKK
jgi:hypothetical protein